MDNDRKKIGSSLPPSGGRRLQRDIRIFGDNELFSVLIVVGGVCMDINNYPLIGLCT